MNRRGKAGEWSKVVIVRLVCNHQVSFKTLDMPRPGVLVWCRQCEKYSHRRFPLPRNVDNKPCLDEWRWVCVSGCRMGMRRYGAGGRIPARAAATAHTGKHPEHEVWLVAPNGIVNERWGVASGQGTLFGNVGDEDVGALDAGLVWEPEKEGEVPF